MTEPIDPYWWCRDDERIAQMIWERVCQPMLLKEIERLDDPATWGLPPDPPKPPATPRLQKGQRRKVR